MDAKEEVRSRLAIEDVIGEYVPLKRAGRSWRGLSPFTDEKTPSFYVSPDKQIWHDFSSNKGGDVFSFVMELEGIDFRSSLELLARKAGVDLSLYEGSFDKSLSEKKQKLLSILDLAATYYQKCLLNINHKKAVDYISKQRGITGQTVLDFRIGYAPDSGYALLDFLKSRGFSENEMYDAGLITKRYSKYGDMFRGRIIITLNDGQGQVVGFTGRILENVKNAPKYLNTPQTLLFDKSRNVFGFYQAKNAIRSQDFAVVVEGNLDVISSHQAGIKNVVATAGTAMTESHLKTLSRLTNNIKLSFDSDKAGIAATERAILIAQKVGIELSVITLPGNFKDPDEVINHDVNLWDKAIKSSKPAVEWLIDNYEKSYDITSVTGKKKVAASTFEILGLINNEVEVEHYVNYLANKINSSPEAIKIMLSNAQQNQKNLRNINSTKRYKKATEAESTNNSQQSSNNQGGQNKDRADNNNKPNFNDQDIILGLAILESKVRVLLNDLEPEVFTDNDRRQIYDILKTRKDGQGIEEDLQEYKECAKIVMFKAESMCDKFGLESSDAKYKGAEEKIKKINKQWRDARQSHLSNLLDEARAKGDSSEVEVISNRLRELLKEKRSAR